MHSICRSVTPALHTGTGRSAVHRDVGAGRRSTVRLRGDLVALERVHKPDPCRQVPRARLPGQREDLQGTRYIGPPAPHGWFVALASYAADPDPLATSTWQRTGLGLRGVGSCCRRMRWTLSPATPIVTRRGQSPDRGSVGRRQRNHGRRERGSDRATGSGWVPPASG